jgi:hypothetical protein
MSSFAARAPDTISWRAVRSRLTPTTATSSLVRGFTTGAVNRVNEISGQNKENIDVLVKEVSRFKVE